MRSHAPDTTSVIENLIASQVTKFVKIPPSDPREILGEKAPEFGVLAQAPLRARKGAIGKASLLRMLQLSVLNAETILRNFDSEGIFPVQEKKAFDCFFCRLFRHEPILSPA